MLKPIPDIRSRRPLSLVILNGRQYCPAVRALQPAVHPPHQALDVEFVPAGGQHHIVEQFPLLQLLLVTVVLDRLPLLLRHAYLLGFFCLHAADHVGGHAVL